ncbi:hypothetical protein [Photobacterium damselae]|uniref:hypothetical protein n=1 Tax=Photobacterium damselae TaxID=38293 RepID=UPI001F1A2A86|nr:hypothetical protein [Photobacterium damselae]UKA04975.1 hypothetical protein IHC89_22275 [Photobacterium damselae subsp. damselae]
MKDNVLNAMIKDLVKALGGTNKVTVKTLYKRDVKKSNSYRYDINKRAIISDKIHLIRFGNNNLAFATYVVDGCFYSAVTTKNRDNIIFSSAPLKQELLTEEINRLIAQNLLPMELFTTIIDAFVFSEYSLLSNSNRAEIKSITEKHNQQLEKIDTSINHIYDDIKEIFDDTISSINNGSLNEEEYDRIYSELEELKEVKRLQAELNEATRRLNEKAKKIRSELSVLTSNEKQSLKGELSDKALKMLSISLPDLSGTDSIEQAYILPKIKKLLRDILKLKRDKKYQAHGIYINRYVIESVLVQCDLAKFIDLKKDILQSDLKYY